MGAGLGLGWGGTRGWDKEWVRDWDWGGTRGLDKGRVREWDWGGVGLEGAIRGRSGCGTRGGSAGGSGGGLGGGFKSGSGGWRRWGSHVG